MEKQFKLRPDQILPIAQGHGSCIATDRITVDGTRVGYMYREEPDNPGDSGWRFFAGDESDEYANRPANLAIYNVNTIANYDPDIAPLLEEPPGTAWRRNALGKFESEEFLH